jgi:hypothetical protein
MPEDDRPPPKRETAVRVSTTGAALAGAGQLVFSAWFVMVAVMAGDNLLVVALSLALVPISWEVCRRYRLWFMKNPPTQ